MTEPGALVREIAERMGLSSLEAMDPERGRVFRAQRDGKPARLKLFEDARNFTAEVEALEILNRRGAPVPRLLDLERGGDGECAALTEWWSGRTLMDAGLPPSTAGAGVLRQSGEALGRVHAAAREDDLSSATFWTRHGYDGWHEVVWGPFIQRRLAKWLELVRLTDDELRAGMDRCLEQVASRTAQVPEPGRWALLHCDFSSRNVMVEADGAVKGVIDFENASVGDPVYDLAKLPWVDLSAGDGELVDAFVEGWESVSGTVADRAVLDTYIGIQAVAAVAWVDKKGPEAAAHQAFRARAMETLTAACARLEHE